MSAPTCNTGKDCVLLLYVYLIISMHWILTALRYPDLIVEVLILTESLIVVRTSFKTKLKFQDVVTPLFYP